MARRSDIDWEAIEKDYRLGQLSIAEVAKKHQVAVSSVKLKAKNNKWERDLTDTVRNATKAAITQERAEQAKRLADSAESIGQEIGREIGRAVNSGLDSDVAAAAALGTAINRKHQSVAEQILEINLRMQQELAATVGRPVELQQLILAVGQNDPLAAEGLSRVLSMGSRAKMLDTLAAAATKAIAIERKAHNLDDEDGKDEDGKAAIVNISF